MNGRRVYADELGWLCVQLQPGDYGRATNALAEGRPSGWWQVCCPDGSEGSLSPENHTVIEHEDGTITVSPSIDISKRKAGAYHGFLQRGVWS